MTLAIDVFADFVCPWCFIGTRRLEQAIAALDDAIRPKISITHRPFFLIPSTPVDGVEVLTMLRERYGAFDPKRFFAPAEAAARDSGIPLVLRKQPRIYPTLSAHVLMRLADRRGTGRALAAALYSAYFLEAQNIGSQEVLVSLAAAHGIAEDEALQVLRDDDEIANTRRDAEQALTMGIHGVPYFVFGGRLAFSGAQPLDLFKRALSQAVSDARLATRQPSVVDR
jgi:predicted DsbA family dithiol-disulfide isomerase